MSLARSKIRPILEVEDLKLSYGDYQVLENVSFSAKKGECLVVMGGQWVWKKYSAEINDWATYFGFE